MTDILSAWRFFFKIFVVPYKIPHLCDHKNTIWLKIYPGFLSQITICNLPTWPESPCTLSIESKNSEKWVFVLKLNWTQRVIPLILIYRLLVVVLSYSKTRQVQIIVAHCAINYPNLHISFQIACSFFDWTWIILERTS